MIVPASFEVEGKRLDVKSMTSTFEHNEKLEGLIISEGIPDVWGIIDYCKGLKYLYIPSTCIDHLNYFDGAYNKDKGKTIFFGASENQILEATFYDQYLKRLTDNYENAVFEATEEDCIKAVLNE